MHHARGSRIASGSGQVEGTVILGSQLPVQVGIPKEGRGGVVKVEGTSAMLEEDLPGRMG
jgi:hypothetical protein